MFKNLFETKHKRGKRLVRELLEKKIKSLQAIGKDNDLDELWSGWEEIELYQTRIKEDTYYGR